MGWAVGHNGTRDIGYGVPALCDHPGCEDEIDRGLGFRCGDINSDHGCGLYFCEKHTQIAGEKRDYERLCIRCYRGDPAFPEKPDIPEWMKHKLKDESWSKWRDANPKEVLAIRVALEKSP